MKNNLFTALWSLIFWLPSMALAQEVATAPDSNSPTHRVNAYLQGRARERLERWASEMRLEAAEALSQAAMPQFSQGERFSRTLTAPLLNGASYAVPHGRYSGNGVLALRSVVEAFTSGEFTSQHRWIEPGMNTGWTFGDWMVLEKHFDVLDSSMTDYLRNSAGLVSGTVARCDVALRYLLHTSSGTEEFFPLAAPANGCHFERNPGTVETCTSVKPNEIAACDTSVFRSRNGRALLKFKAGSQPYIQYADGSILNFRPSTVNALGQIPNGEFAVSMGEMGLQGTLAVHVAESTVALNGLKTEYEYDSNDRLIGAKLPNGAISRLEKTAYGYEATATGIAGHMQSWKYYLEDITFNLDAFSGVTCRGQVNATFQNLPCSSPQTRPTNAAANTLRVLKKMVGPDGRVTTFEYNDMGLLSAVNSPTGDRTQFVYGNANTRTFLPFIWVPVESANLSPGVVPEGTSRFEGFRLVQTIYSPTGKACDPSGPSTYDCMRTFVDHESQTSQSNNPNCGTIQWTKVTSPDGSVSRTAQCAGTAASRHSMTLQTIYQEVYEPGTYQNESSKPFSVSYFGDRNTGSLWAEYSVVGPTQWADRTGDLRSVKTVSGTDDIFFTNVQTYDPLTINVLQTQSYLGAFLNSAPTGTPVSKSVMTYVDRQEYQAQNIFGLVRTVTTYGQNNEITGHLETLYDNESFADEALQPHLASNFAGLEPFTTVRGLPTKIRSFLNPASPGNSEVYETVTEYYDLGSVYRVFDATQAASRGLATVVNTPDFSRCTDKPVLTSVASAFVGQGDFNLNYQTTTVSDCYSGAVLKTIGINGEVSCSQYNRLGMLLAQAGPGDSLIDIPNSIKDDSCLGSTGPTVWYDYPTLGQNGPIRTVTHVKDKTKDGYVTRSFTDTAGRVIQTCSESVDVDKEPQVIGQPLPDGTVLSGENLVEEGEFCSRTYFDALGRVDSVTSAFFRKGDFESLGTVPSDVFLSKVQYDGRGRVVLAYTARASGEKIEELGQTATQYTFETYNGQIAFVVKTTDGEGNSAKTYTNALGQQVLVKSPVSIEASGCTKNASGYACSANIACRADAYDGKLYCHTRFEYDNASRLIAIIDAHQNRTEFKYDGFGRRIWMKDPDVGQTFYEYGKRGLLASSDWYEGSGIALSRADYKRTTYYGYDLAGRSVVIDTPIETAQGWVNGPDDDDQITYYDEYKNDCYSCDFSQGLCQLSQQCEGSVFGL